MNTLKGLSKKIQSASIVFPALYMFIAVFLVRSSVYYFFIATGLFIASMVLLNRKRGLKKETVVALCLIVLASIGLVAATILTVEELDLIKDPNHVTSCSISPIVACARVIKSDESSIFAGIPNSLIGIFGFACILTAGMTILAGAKNLNKHWWRALVTGIAFNAIFCGWLIYQGLYVINSLCLYCMTTWIVTFSLLWIVLAQSIENKSVSFGEKINKFTRFRNDFIIVTILAIFGLIFVRWSDYWLSLF